MFDKKRKPQPLINPELFFKNMQKVLNTREVKVILKWLKEQYGIKELKIDSVFLKSTKDRIYLSNKYISELEPKSLRINLIGMYFATEEPNGVRLSIEGSQIIGPKSTKNVAELNKKQIADWMRGEDIEYQGSLKGFVIIKCDNDFYGVGGYKEGKILNYVSKDRRIKRLVS